MRANMKYVELGRSGIQISQITHGCMELGGGFSGLNWKVEEKETNIRLLRLALENGINIFDTAEVYGDGNSEKIVGEALKEVRDKCLIATKVSPDHLDKQGVKTAAENSLRRLDTEYIDLLYVHWPNADIPMEETMEAFNQLKKEGKIRSIGVSNFNLEQLTTAQKLAQIDALQIEYNLLEQKNKEELIDLSNKNQISVFCYNSIAKGILSGAFHFGGKTLSADDFRNNKPLFSAANLENEKPLMELLKNVAGNHDASISQIALAWMLQGDRISSAIVGTQNEKHFLGNIAAVDIELTKEEMVQLNQVSKETIDALV